VRRAIGRRPAVEQYRLTHHPSNGMQRQRLGLRLDQGLRRSSRHLRQGMLINHGVPELIYVKES
jgi:hypothetical protein